MSILISLASDFIDKMNNPSYGVLINEEYSLKFNDLLGQENFNQVLRNEIAQVKNADELTSYGWLWLLKWCRANEVELSQVLTKELMRRWANVFIQISIIDLATFREEERISGGISNQPEFNNSWLKDVVMETLQDSAQLRDNLNEGETNTRDAENLLITLLQMGNRISLLAAKYLLSYQWRGQQKLRNFLRQRYARLDEETKIEWMETLGIKE
jgi:hypothetical protein